MENIIVAVSNFPCYLPIRTALRNRDYITASAVMFVALMSFLSHLVENHKHGMPGIGVSTTVSYYLNRLDVLGCVIVISRFLCVYYLKHGLVIVYDPWLFVGLTLSFLLLRISEYGKYNPDLKSRYIPIAFAVRMLQHSHSFSMAHDYLPSDGLLLGNTHLQLMSSDYYSLIDDGSQPSLLGSRD